MAEALEHNPCDGDQMPSIIDLPKGNRMPTIALKTYSLIIHFALKALKKLLLLKLNYIANCVHKTSRGQRLRLL